MTTDTPSLSPAATGSGGGPHPTEPSPERLVDLVVATFAASHRPVHTLGMGLVGSFSPATGAASFCRARIFQEPSRVIARFSDGVGSVLGDETQPDVRGLAVRFFQDDPSVTDGSGDLDLVAMTLPSFFARTAEDFAEFCRLSAPAPATGVADKRALQEWLAQHPTSMAAVEYVGRLGIDVSYGGVSYYGVHAFEFEGPSGSTFARFSWVPDTPVPPLPRGTDMTGKPRDRLRREMTERARTGRSPGFSLVAQVQGPGDATDDPTVLWTSTDRRTLGHLQLGGLVEDQYWGCEALHFNPTRLIDGINQSPDPILAARARAYEVSAERRCAAYPVPARMPSPSHGV